MVWTGINLPNLRQHIAPVRGHADLVVVKAADHAVSRILAGGA
jgi:type I pantothenate kinase